MSLATLTLTLVLAIDTGTEASAAHTAKVLMTGAEAYAISAGNGEGRYPITLDELDRPHFGGPSILKVRVESFGNPWGSPYRCCTGFDDRGEVQFYVWVERVVNGKVRRIGLPPPEKK